jgi:hypothetical protein
VELNKLVAVTVVASAALVSCRAAGDSAGAALAGRVENPVVSQATGGHGTPLGGLRYDVTQFGYQEKEYFFEGTAKTYPPVTLPTASYRSRMIVWTPTDPARFNGTTVVEWAEVSDFGQFELTVELNYESPMLEQQGFAFVLVSAEQRGICDHTPTGCTSTSLQGADPDRYGSLDHPGDAYSFDIFSQAMQAIKHPVGTAPLGTLKTRILIAEGFQRSVDKYFPTGAPAPSSPSTSPFSIYGPLNDYLANGADDDARLADAFLIDAAAPRVEPRYRVPTLHHLDESAIRRTPTPDSRNHVTWEITGAPHVDPWAAGHTDIPSTDAPKPKLTRPDELARRDKYDNFGQDAFPAGDVPAPAPSTGSTFPRRFTLNAALADLRTWVAKGIRAPAAPRIERTAAVPDSPTKKLNRDRDGNAIGGLRSPIIQVPFATYDGEAFVSSGTTISLPPERIAQLYPTHESYMRRLLTATNEAVADRFLVCQDGETIMRKASISTVGGLDQYTAAPRCARRSK